MRRILYDTTNQHWERSHALFATTPITNHNGDIPRETFMVTMWNLTGRLHHQASNRWGRWVSQEFTGRASRKFVVISAYQVVQQSTTGPITVAQQQQSLSAKLDDPLGDPRAAFRRDLWDNLEQYQRKHFEILLVGDFNEKIGSDPGGISKITTELGTFKPMMATQHSAKPPALCIYEVHDAWTMHWPQYSTQNPYITPGMSRSMLAYIRIIVGIFSTSIHRPYLDQIRMTWRHFQIAFFNHGRYTK